LFSFYILSGENDCFEKLHTGCDLLEPSLPPPLPREKYKNEGFLSAKRIKIGSEEVDCVHVQNGVFVRELHWDALRIMFGRFLTYHLMKMSKKLGAGSKGFEAAYITKSVHFMLALWHSKQLHMLWFF